MNLLNKDNMVDFSLRTEFKSYLETASIHGLFFIGNTSAFKEKIVWSLLIVGNLMIAGKFIYSSMVSWSNTPVVTSVELKPVTDVLFPAVTVCPHGIDKPAIMEHLIAEANFDGLREVVARNKNLLEMVFFVADQNAQLAFHEQVCGSTCSDEFNPANDLPKFADDRLSKSFKEVVQKCNLGNKSYQLGNSFYPDLMGFTAKLIEDNLDYLFAGNNSVLNVCERLKQFLDYHPTVSAISQIFLLLDEKKNYKFQKGTGSPSYDYMTETAARECRKADGNNYKCQNSSRILEAFNVLDVLNKMTIQDLAGTVVNTFRPGGEYLISQIGWDPDNGQEIVDNIHEDLSDYFHQLTLKVFPDNDLFVNMSIVDLVDLVLIKSRSVFSLRITRPDRKQLSKKFTAMLEDCGRDYLSLTGKSYEQPGACKKVYAKCPHVCDIYDKSIKEIETNPKIKQVN